MPLANMRLLRRSENMAILTPGRHVRQIKNRLAPRHTESPVASATIQVYLVTMDH